MLTTNVIPLRHCWPSSVSEKKKLIPAKVRGTAMDSILAAEELDPSTSSLRLRRSPRPHTTTITSSKSRRLLFSKPHLIVHSLLNQLLMELVTARQLKSNSAPLALTGEPR